MGEGVLGERWIGAAFVFAGRVVGCNQCELLDFRMNRVGGFSQGGVLLLQFTVGLIHFAWALGC